MPKQGDIVLVKIPFSDLTSSKKRPVLIVSKDEYNDKQDDIIVAAITSNLAAKDYAVEFDNNDMADGTILKKSCVRSDKIYTLEKSMIEKKFGTLSSDAVTKVIELIYNVLENA